MDGTLGESMVAFIKSAVLPASRTVPPLGSEVDPLRQGQVARPVDIVVGVGLESKGGALYPLSTGEFRARRDRKTIKNRLRKIAGGAGGRVVAASR